MNLDAYMAYYSTRVQNCRQTLGGWKLAQYCTPIEESLTWSRRKCLGGSISELHPSATEIQAVTPAARLPPHHSIGAEPSFPPSIAASTHALTLVVGPTVTCLLSSTPCWTWLENSRIVFFFVTVVVSEANKKSVMLMLSVYRLQTEPNAAVSGY